MSASPLSAASSGRLISGPVCAWLWSPQHQVLVSTITQFSEPPRHQLFEQLPVHCALDDHDGHAGPLRGPPSLRRGTSLAGTCSQRLLEAMLEPVQIRDPRFIETRHARRMRPRVSSCPLLHLAGRRRARQHARRRPPAPQRAPPRTISHPISPSRRLTRPTPHTVNTRHRMVSPPSTIGMSCRIVTNMGFTRRSSREACAQRPENDEPKPDGGLRHHRRGDDDEADEKSRELAAYIVDEQTIDALPCLGRGALTGEGSVH